MERIFCKFIPSMGCTKAAHVLEIIIYIYIYIYILYLRIMTVLASLEGESHEQEKYRF